MNNISYGNSREAIYHLREAKEHLADFFETTKLESFDKMAQQTRANIDMLLEAEQNLLKHQTPTKKIRMDGFTQ